MLSRPSSAVPFPYWLNLTTSWSFLSVWMIQMKEPRFIMLATIDFSLCGPYGIPLRLPSHTAELLLDAAFLCNVVHTKNYYFFLLLYRLNNVSIYKVIYFDMMKYEDDGTIYSFSITFFFFLLYPFLTRKNVLLTLVSVDSLHAKKRKSYYYYHAYSL